MVKGWEMWNSILKMNFFECSFISVGNDIFFLAL